MLVQYLPLRCEQSWLKFEKEMRDMQPSTCLQTERERESGRPSVGVGGNLAGELVIQQLPPHLITLVQELKSTDSKTGRIL